MPSTQKNNDQELNRIEQLINTGHYKEALQSVETLEQQNNLSPTARLTCNLLKSRLMNRLGRYEDRLDRYEEGLRLAQTVFKESQHLQKRLQGVDALSEMRWALVYLRREDELLDAIEHGEHELTRLTRDQPAKDPQRKAILLLEKQAYYFMKGEMDRALECGQQSLAICKKTDNKYFMAEILNALGAIYRMRGELGRALKYYQKSLALSEELDHKPNITETLYHIGITYAYARKGELDRALEYYQQSITIAEELGYKQFIVRPLNAIGEVYRLKGDLNRALGYYQQTLAFAEEFDHKKFIIVSLNNIGIIYNQIGNLDQAVVYLEQSLALSEGFVGFHREETFYHLISIAIDMTLFDQAQQYLHRLQQLYKQVPDNMLQNPYNKLLSQWCRVAESLVLKTSPRARHKGKAEELLTQVVEEEVIHNEVTVLALLHLCDLLLTELRTTGDPGLLDEVKIHVIRLLEIAKQFNSHWWLTETYVLQSKLALVELDVKGARQFLAQAQHLAEERGLHQLAMRISTEYDALLDQLGQWEDFIARNVSFVERTELAHLTEQIMLMIHKRVVELPELPQEVPGLVLIIGADSGLSVFSKSFHPDKPFAEHLIAGFLTAINAFGRDAFAEKGSIERIKYADYTLLLKLVEPFLVSYVFQGPSYYALKKLEQFIEALQASKVAWQALTNALVTKRFVAQEGEIDTLITEMFST